MIGNKCIYPGYGYWYFIDIANIIWGRIGYELYN